MKAFALHSTTFAATTIFLSSLSYINCNAYENAGYADNKILLEDFSTSSVDHDQHHVWEELNDSVVGGSSTGIFKVKHIENISIGHFIGHVRYTKSLQGPGFVRMKTLNGEKNWPDVSMCQGFELNVKSHSDYTGFGISIGRYEKSDYSVFQFGYKANMEIPKSANQEAIPNIVHVPFTDFTHLWDHITGNALITCEENEEYCPDVNTLRNLYSFVIWGEGVEGAVDLEIYNIQAYGCAGSYEDSNTKNEGITLNNKIENDTNPSNHTSVSSSSFLAMSKSVAILGLIIGAIAWTRRFRQGKHQGKERDSSYILLVETNSSENESQFNDI